VRKYFAPPTTSPLPVQLTPLLLKKEEKKRKKKGKLGKENIREKLREKRLKQQVPCCFKILPNICPLLRNYSEQRNFCRQLCERQWIKKMEKEKEKREKGLVTSLAPRGVEA
jgi:hypothetical protein